MFCMLQNSWPLAPLGPTYDPTAPAISLQSKRSNITQFFRNTIVTILGRRPTFPTATQKRAFPHRPHQAGY